MMKPMKYALRTFSGVAVGVALAIASSNIGAAVLHEQLPNQVNGYMANTVTPQQLADNFTLSGAAKLTSITWWGVNAGAGGTADDFLVRLYSSISGTGTVLQSFSAGAVPATLTGNTVANAFDEYQYDFTLASPLDLAAGTYYLFVQNLKDDPAWAWETGAPGDGALSFRTDDTEPWVGVNDDLAFRLNGAQAIPEPGSMALLLLAGTALLVTRRNVNRRQQQ